LSRVSPHMAVGPSRPASNFYNSKTAEQLWDGVSPRDIKVHTGGKRLVRKARKDLNDLRPVGTGKLGILWPGLNTPVKDWVEINKTQDTQAKLFKMPTDDAQGTPHRSHVRQSPAINQSSRVEPVKAIEISRIAAADFAARVAAEESGIPYKSSFFDKRDQADKNIRRRSFNAPVEIRGWTSKGYGGLKVGAPKAVERVDFSKFDTRILENKRVSVMKGKIGRRYRQWVLVVTGNKNGLIGFGFAKAEYLRNAVSQAQRIAANRLVYIERFDNSTLFQDDSITVDRTTVHMRRKEHGSGIKAHRALQDVLELAGFTDVYAKIQGRVNVLKAVQASFHLLSKQRPYQVLADEKKLNVVMFHRRFPDFPVLLAAPSDGETVSASSNADSWREELAGKTWYIDHRDHAQRMARYAGIVPNRHPFHRPGKLVPFSFTARYRDSLMTNC
jgi:small subunit ribosomal protein S5